MPRKRFQTLTEPMFYVLLCLRSERCGTEILQTVRELTAGRVQIGSGTLYDLLEQFTQAGMIVETKTQGRKRSYRITPQGEYLLEAEYQRLKAQTADYVRLTGKE